MQFITLVCRSGFESEAGQEVTDRAAHLGVYGYFQPLAPGLVGFMVSEPAAVDTLMQSLPLTELVFVRDWLVALDRIELPKADRVGALCDAFMQHQALLPPCDRVEVRLREDNNDADLGNFARKWVSPLARGLRQCGLLQPADVASAGRLEVLLLSFEQVLMGVSYAANRAATPGGILRLKASHEAPSRSALKLEEAWKVFVPEDAWFDVLGGGKKAVDLGAAPGGWTWQLVRQGMLVTAVDNGPMQPALMASGHVEHVKADGYRWRPHRAVDWMVCDIVDKPRRTATLVASWFQDRLCRYAVVNLKLPMKKRYQEWLACQDIILQGLQAAGGEYRFSAKQLYHDREEVTCYLERLD